MDYNAISQTDAQYIANTYARYPVALESGSGVYCTDTEGKTYLDFTSGIGVNALGFCHPAWVKNVTEQAAKLTHISNYFYFEPGARLAKILCERAGMKKMFFGNSGAEANEGAIKAARRYSFDKYGDGRSEIVTLKDSFHGRTLTTLTATGQDSFHTVFGPFSEGFFYAGANDLDDVKTKISDKTCAIIMELVQGEGGVNVLEPEFVRGVAALCAERDILLILDEVQCGIGRTGTLFCYQQYGISPDIVTAAKGLGGGLPIGAVLFGEKTEFSLRTGDHGSTFGMNPLSCAGALAVMDELTGELLESVKAKGEYLTTQLTKIPQVENVTGLGLMTGIALKGLDAKAVVKQCIKNGLLVLTAKDKIRFLPALNIPQTDLERGIALFAQSLEETV